MCFGECGSTLYVGLQHAVPPTNTNSSRYFSRLKQVYNTQTFTSTEHHISSLQLHLWDQLVLDVHFCCLTKTRNSCDFLIINIIRECGSTLYVGLQHAVALTNTKFKPLLEWVCCTQTLTSTEHHISSLYSHFLVKLSSGSPSLPPTKKGNSCSSSSK